MNGLHYIKAGEEGFKNEMLDELLKAGYYRSQHLMFTCNETVITEEGEIIPVFWLRTLVNECKPGKSANAILKKCSRFLVKYCSAYVDETIESLYQLYKQHVPFSVAETCAGYLHQYILPQPFNSMMVQVYDGKTLIAAGYFDEGNHSIAGIMNIYYPHYKNYSLGKFLILQKLKYALQKKLTYYYTGYISTKSVRFDYKVFPDINAVEILLPMHREWIPFNLIDRKFLDNYYSKFIENNDAV